MSANKDNRKQIYYQDQETDSCSFAAEILFLEIHIASQAGSETSSSWAGVALDSGAESA
jgi:hypothetical protein